MNSSPKKNKLTKPLNALNVRKTQTHDAKAKTVLFAHRHISIHQRYKYCPHCAARFYPLESELGNDNTYTKPLKSLAARCCGLGSYRVAEDNLRELCGISLSPMTIGNLTAAVADEMKEHPENDSVQRERFQQAKGKSMFGADGTSVHTRNADETKQWREMKVGVFAKRERGKSALPADWDKRQLPKSTAVSAFAMIAESEEFQERCQRERRRLGVSSVTTTVRM